MKQDKQSKCSLKEATNQVDKSMALIFNLETKNGQKTIRVSLSLTAMSRVSLCTFGVDLVTQFFTSGDKVGHKKTLCDNFLNNENFNETYKADLQLIDYKLQSKLFFDFICSTRILNNFEVIAQMSFSSTAKYSTLLKSAPAMNPIELFYKLMAGLAFIVNETQFLSMVNAVNVKELGLIFFSISEKLFLR